MMSWSIAGISCTLHMEGDWGNASMFHVIHNFKISKEFNVIGSNDRGHIVFVIFVCLFSTLTFAVTFEPCEVKVSYLACILHEWCPFNWHRYVRVDALPFIDDDGSVYQWNVYAVVDALPFIDNNGGVYQWNVYAVVETYVGHGIPAGARHPLQKTPVNSTCRQPAWRKNAHRHQSEKGYIWYARYTYIYICQRRVNVCLQQFCEVYRTEGTMNACLLATILWDVPNRGNDERIGEG